MKGRESGMPDEAWWASFFEPEGALDRLLDLGRNDGGIVEFGCGYGTFTLPAARRTRGTVVALDIEPALVEAVRGKAERAGLGNVQACVRDFVADGTGLAGGSQAHAMIYNLLHLEAPLALLREAHRNLAPGGTLSVIHWRSDMPTPRGPSLAIRPTPEQCAAWIGEAGFRELRTVDLQSSCPYHFGLVARR
ncbi:class I SAM-dependent methyltransferase [Azospira restricta]|uniref:Class I SAM-dependent methyltransferase n=1 Tax=Azospira restricta TaxID=404405 RepID=A0A974SP13_9RHOO|nr:class I SAM-dependent methyltransferase [Azospira restricta]QRJ63811.1 class I SAM-dependent methyltransferase [Azospira restricta]